MLRGGRALNGLGAQQRYRTQSNSECRDVQPGSQTAGDKLRGREEKSPDRRLRSPNRAKWKRKWDRPDSQEVGLEAAILETTSNIGLVERSCAENPTGLKPDTEAADWPCASGADGRGAFCSRVKRDRKDSWTRQK